MRVHLFNPENDLALADNSANYTPPAGARHLAEAGSLLPVWWATDGDIILARNDIDTALWLNEMTHRFNLPEITITSEVNNIAARPAPWGWSRAAARRFELAGVKSLPDNEALLRIRELSHRHISIDINSRLQQMGFDTPPLPVMLTDSTRYITSTPVIAKSPWSSSGRGVLDSTTMSDDYFRWQLNGIIRRQGSVIIEQRLDRITDLAMLFTARDGRVDYRGLSLFHVNEHSQYTGNYVQPQAALMSSLLGSTSLPHSLFEDMATALKLILADIIGHDYEGNLGVDMMIYRDNSNRCRLAPCIEVNLRNTMGHVALTLSEKILASGSRGHLSILPANLKQPNHGETADDNAIIDNGKLVSGTISLVPPRGQFTFTLSATQSSTL